MDIQDLPSSMMLFLLLAVPAAVRSKEDDSCINSHGDHTTLLQAKTAAAVLAPGICTKAQLATAVAEMTSHCQIRVAAAAGQNVPHTDLCDCIAQVSNKTAADMTCFFNAAARASTGGKSRGLLSFQYRECKANPPTPLTWPAEGSGDAVCASCYFAKSVPRAAVAPSPGGCVLTPCGESCQICANTGPGDFRVCSTTADVWTAPSNGVCQFSSLATTPTSTSQRPQSTFVVQGASDNLVCDESYRIAASCVSCGPQWGDLQKCQQLCESHDSCAYLAYFGDNGCRIYTSCQFTSVQTYGVTTTIYKRELSQQVTK